MHDLVADKLFRIHALMDPNPLIQKFVDYTERHRNKVLELGTTVNIAKRAWLHDMDKYEPNRMLAYTNYHYGEEKTQEIIDKYNQYHQSHVMDNEHHPQYWYDKDKQMTFESWLEMLCDWISAGICTINHYKSSDTLDYYKSDDRHLLDPLPKIKLITEEWLKKYAEDINEFNLLSLRTIYQKYI